MYTSFSSSCVDLEGPEPCQNGQEGALKGHRGMVEAQCGFLNNKKRSVWRGV